MLFSEFLSPQGDQEARGKIVTPVELSRLHLLVASYFNASTALENLLGCRELCIKEAE
jgi:hypothetical protein